MSIANLIHMDTDSVMVNARIKYLPDDNGTYKPYELTCFDRAIIKPDGWELSGTGRQTESSYSLVDDKFLVDECCSPANDKENRRKSFSRARNNLFDILLSTIDFDSFATLTVSSSQADRYDYCGIVRSLGIWLDNRVRRNGLKYCFVPERHKDGAIHFHGLVNKNSLKLNRAVSPYTGLPMSDNCDRPIYNITDYKLGFTTLIPLSGSNARIAAAKYCYKYITKSGGEKVGGRYYLSGGDLGRPKFEYVNYDFDSIDARAVPIEQAHLNMKRVRL